MIEQLLNWTRLKADTIRFTSGHGRARGDIVLICQGRSKGTSGQRVKREVLAAECATRNQEVTDVLHKSPAPRTHSPYHESQASTSQRTWHTVSPKFAHWVFRRNNGFIYTESSRGLSDVTPRTYGQNLWSVYGVVSPLLDAPLKQGTGLGRATCSLNCIRLEQCAKTSQGVCKEPGKTLNLLRLTVTCGLAGGMASEQPMADIERRARADALRGQRSSLLPDDPENGVVFAMSFYDYV
ncbi:hypothetical protein Bbelb_152050 [Branchiostoma belcheri]|nr:hypothetical protein Bbelb_152050 [Branchiostoma belcheri]